MYHEIYIFEALYTNIETDENTIKRIGFEAAPDDNYQTAFKYALNEAFELQGENEELYEVRNVAC